MVIGNWTDNLVSTTGRCIGVLMVLVAIIGCGTEPGEMGLSAPAASPVAGAKESMANKVAQRTTGAGNSSPASVVFAGGCFWCMEPPFDHLEGVLATTSGYAGGHVADPTYEQVTYENTGHLESVRVTYDPAIVSFEELLAVYWHNVDPFDATGQFCDKGSSYKTAIFVNNPAERTAAEKTLAELSQRFTKKVVVPVREYTNFYPAEGYHQDYYTKNPLRYRYYRYGCGRDARLAEVWGEKAGNGLPL